MGVVPALHTHCAGQPTAYGKETPIATPIRGRHSGTCVPAHRASARPAGSSSGRRRTSAWTLQMRLQRLRHLSGQHSHAILAALAVADQDLAALEFHVLHPQPHALHQPHAGAVVQPRHQCQRALQPIQQPPGFVQRQYRGLAALASWRARHRKARASPARAPPCKEKQGRQRLVLRRRGHAAVHPRWVRNAVISSAPISCGWRLR